jgi:hypothetical protein
MFEISNDVSKMPLMERLTRWSRTRFLKPFVQENARIREHHQKFRERSEIDHLSATEIEYWASRVNTLDHIENRREGFRTLPVDKNLHAFAAPLMDRLIAFDPSIRSAVEVGVYWGAVIDYLAGKYPAIQFTGVDIMRDLKTLNAEFDRRNLQFVSGYAVDMLEQGELSADALFFNVTATRMTENELFRFLRAIASQCRYVVISEPLMHRPGGEVVNPDRLRRSTPTALSAPEWPPQFVHNYRALAETGGFKTLHYRVYEPEFWRGIHRIDYIGQVT